MPSLIEMRLKATREVRQGTRQLHGLACALFEGGAVADAGHAGQDKPWTVTPLRPVPGGAPDEWRWRAAWLPDGPVPPAASAAGALRVGHASCVVVESAQRRVSHAALASGPAAGEVTVSFGSPACFSRNGTDVPVPDPRLIAGSWRRRWNGSLPEADALWICDEAWRDAHRLMELAASGLRTQARDSGYGRPRAGFTGSVTLRTARGAPAAVRGMLAALARFAEYSGTGAQVTHGFGATTMTGSR